MTFVLQWHPGPPRPLLRWWVFDGHLSTADLSSPRAAASVLGSWDYADTASVPSAGTEKFHFNAWQANWGESKSRRRPSTSRPDCPVRRARPNRAHCPHPHPAFLTAGGAPGFGRTAHLTIAGFDHTPEWIDIPAAGVPLDGAYRALREEARAPAPSCALLLRSLPHRI